MVWTDSTPPPHQRQGKWPPIKTKATEMTCIGQQNSGG